MHTYILFYDHIITATNPFDRACFSQWFPAAFIDSDYPSVTFKTAEHYMMYRKALLFEPEAAQAIVDADTPAEAKQRGREIKNFDRKTWDMYNDGIVETANYCKFGQHDDLKAAVFKTKGKTLVEASPTDRIWGIGYSAEDAPGNEDKWGQNRMGLALTRARDKLLAEQDG